MLFDIGGIFTTNRIAETLVFLASEYFSPKTGTNFLLENTHCETKIDLFQMSVSSQKRNVGLIPFYHDGIVIMKLEVLMSCMHQQDDQLVQRSQITGNAVVINQCGLEEYAQYSTEKGIARMYSTCQRGLTKSRNMAIRNATADICLLCDDDEIFVSNYEGKILQAYESLPQADVVIFKIVNRPPSFPDKTIRLRFPRTLKVSSWQISFRRERLLSSGIWFDEFLGAGTGNGAEEELKFLTDCEKAGLRIYYVPVEIASVAQTKSTWFHGFTEEFFENRGATTRYILGYGIASIYALYYIICKRELYRETLSALQALRAIFRGIHKNKIAKMKKAQKEHLPQ